LFFEFGEKPICALGKPIPFQLVASNLRTFVALNNFGISSSLLGINHGLGAQSNLDLSTNQQIFGSDVFSTETFLLNPFLGLASQKRSRQVIVRSQTLNSEGSGVYLDSILSGATVLAVANVDSALQQAGKSPNWYPSIPVSFNSSGILNSPININSAANISFSVRWAASCSAPAAAVLLILFVTSARKVLINRSSPIQYSKTIPQKESSSQSALPSPTTKRKSLKSPTGGPIILSSVVTQWPSESNSSSLTAKDIAQKSASNTAKSVSRESGVIILEIFALIGWFLFAIGVGLNGSIQSSYNAIYFNIASGLGLSGSIQPSYNEIYFYILAITGCSSCLLAIRSRKMNYPVMNLVSTCLLSLSCISAGAVTHFISYNGYTNSWTRLTLTGAALFGASKSVSVGIISSRHSKVSVELENVILACSILTVVGWILVAIGLGRFSINVAEITSLGFSPIAAVISASFASVLIGLSTFFNEIPMMIAANGLSVVSLFLSGGLLGMVWGYCCGYQVQLMQSGGIIIIISLTMAIGARNWNFETEEEKQQQLYLRYQSGKERRDLRKKSVAELKSLGITPFSFAKGSVTVEGLNSVVLKNSTKAFDSISNRPKRWFIWRIVALIATIGYLLFLGAFGSSIDFDNEGLGTGILFAVLGPISLGTYALALIKDSRLLATLGCVSISCAIFGLGGILNLSIVLSQNVSALMAAPSVIITLVGAFIFFLASVPLSGSLVHRFKLGYSHILPQFVLFSITIFWLLFTVGLGLWISGDIDKMNNNDVNRAALIIGSTVSSISIALQFIFIYTEAIDSPSKLSPLPHSLTLASLLEVGASTSKSAVYLMKCSTSNCGISKVGPSLVLVGGIGYALFCIILLCWVFLRGEVVREIITTRDILNLSDSDDTSEIDENLTQSDDSEKSKGSRASRKSNSSKALPKNVHDLLLAWPFHQSIFQIGVSFMMCFMAITIASLGALRPDRTWINDYVGIVILCIFGSLTPIFFILWYLNGNHTSFVLSTFSLLISIITSGHTLFWSFGQRISSFSYGILIGSVGYFLCGTLILILTLSWNQPPLSKFQKDEFLLPNIFLSIKVAGMLIFVISFGLGAKDPGLPATSFFVCSMLFASIVPSICIVYIFMHRYKWTILRIILILQFSISCACCGALVHGISLRLSYGSSILSSTGTAYLSAMLTGCLISLICNILFLQHYAIVFTKVELTEQESKHLSENPARLDENLSWLHSPSSHFVSIVFKILISLTGLGCIFTIVGFSLLSTSLLTQPVELHHILIVSSVFAVACLALFALIKWKVFSVLSILASIISFGCGGSVIYSTSPSIKLDSFAALSFAGQITLLCFLCLSISLMLHKSTPALSGNLWPTLVSIIILSIVLISWILIIVSIGLTRGNSGTTSFITIGIGFITLCLLIYEKANPGRILHPIIRPTNVISCSLTMIASSGMALQSAGLNAYLGFAASLGLLIGSAAYIIQIFFITNILKLLVEEPSIERESDEQMASINSVNLSGETLSDPQRGLSTSESAESAESAESDTRSTKTSTDDSDSSIRSSSESKLSTSSQSSS
jgi:hypothetical protein